MVRQAKREDMPAIRALYAASRQFMAENGNPTQWGDTYPPEDMLLEDIKKKHLYVCCDDGGVYGVFALIFGVEPCYNEIDGAWKDDTPYAAIHRVSGGRGRGAARECLSFAKAVYPHLRIDTHADNLPMQHCIEKNGFARRGIVIVDDGTPRIAYEYSR